MNKILLNSTPNGWSKQACVQGHGWESLNFFKAVNMFDRMEISESIYEDVVEPSYKKPTRADADRSGPSRNKRGESASSKNHPKTVESSGKRQKIM